MCTLRISMDIYIWGLYYQQIINDEVRYMMNYGGLRIPVYTIDQCGRSIVILVILLNEKKLFICICGYRNVISCIMAFDDHSEKSFLIITACECEFFDHSIFTLHWSHSMNKCLFWRGDGWYSVTLLSWCSKGDKSLILSTREF